MDQQQQSVGNVTMQADGTLVFVLRAETEDGAVGHSSFTSGPEDPSYKSYLEHIGGIEPGQTKLVPPWPDP